MGVSGKGVALADLSSFIFLDGFHSELEERLAIVDVFRETKAVSEDVVVLFENLGL